MDTLKEAWDQQRAYNDLLKDHRLPMEENEWAKTYLLGLSSELGEVLREINWKVHRSPGSVNSHSLAIELADLTKYTWCLWQLFGWDQEDMLRWVNEKTEVMNFRMQQELGPPIEDSYVLVLDLDGTVADWRMGFINWLLKHQLIEQLPTDPERSLSLDIDMGWSYSTYSNWKNSFEHQGGFATLPPFLSNVRLVNEWRASDPRNKLVIVTARPTDKPRVWYDTYAWLRDHGMIPDQMHFTQDGRIRVVLDLARTNREVVLLDDNPDIHMRSLHNELRVLVPARGYNWSIVPDPPRVVRHEDLYRMWREFSDIMPGGSR